jgi:hypothetical protein
VLILLQDIVRKQDVCFAILQGNGKLASLFLTLDPIDLTGLSPGIAFPEKHIAVFQKLLNKKGVGGHIQSGINVQGFGTQVFQYPAVGQVTEFRSGFLGFLPQENRKEEQSYGQAYEEIPKSL